jgi:hypothetical protein
VIRSSGAPAEATDIARISPLAHAHVIPSGTYHFERATATADAASVAQQAAPSMRSMLVALFRQSYY